MIMSCWSCQVVNRSTSVNMLIICWSWHQSCWSLCQDHDQHEMLIMQDQQWDTCWSCMLLDMIDKSSTVDQALKSSLTRSSCLSHAITHETDMMLCVTCYSVTNEYVTHARLTHSWECTHVDQHARRSTCDLTHVDIDIHDRHAWSTMSTYRLSIDNYRHSIHRSSAMLRMRFDLLRHMSDSCWSSLECESNTCAIPLLYHSFRLVMLEHSTA